MSLSAGQLSGSALVALALVAPAATVQAQTIERMKLTDSDLNCAQIHAEIGQMDTVMALNAQSAMGQQARARKEFLTGFFVQRGCKLSDIATTPATTPATAPATAPARVAPAAVAPVAAPPAVPAAAPVAAALPATAAAPDWKTLLGAAITPAPGANVRGSASLKGKRFYVSEYRVMFEVSGAVTASSRAAYFGGTNYGATRMTVNYQAPGLDIAALQAVTDRAYADFLERLEAAGVKPEPAEAITREHGVVYEASVEPSRVGAPVIEDFDLGYGSRKYMVFAPTGMKLNPRGFAGLGAGNIGNRISYTKGNLEAISVAIAVNIAAQESSGSGSSLFRSGSSANASAAMEIATTRHGLFQSHAHTYGMQLGGPVAVPGQFASFREMGGYDSRQDAAVQGIQALGRLMGQAGNQSRRVDMAIDVDMPAMARMAVSGLAAVNAGIAANVK